MAHRIVTSITLCREIQAAWRCSPDTPRLIESERLGCCSVTRVGMTIDIGNRLLVGVYHLEAASIFSTDQGGGIRLIRRRRRKGRSAMKPRNRLRPPLIVRFVHASAVPPITDSSLKAVLGVIARFSARIWESSKRDNSSARASRVLEKPKGGKTRSRNIAPGCEEQRRGWRRISIGSPNAGRASWGGAEVTIALIHRAKRCWSRSKLEPRLPPINRNFGREIVTW